MSRVPVRRPSRVPSLHAVLLGATLLVAGGTLASAALRTSATFDEVWMVSAGARALETGSWALVVDQPPLVPFLYGLPFQVFGGAAGITYPSETDARWAFRSPWDYGREFYFRAGNGPVRVTLMSRAVSAAFALALVLLAWLYGRWIEGRRAALAAAFLVAFLPDVLAHGGVAYNDIPLAFTFLAAIWALDLAVRQPGLGLGVLAGVAVGVVLGVKFSAVAVGPVAMVLVLVEGLSRPRKERRAWGARLALAGAAGLATTYALLVVMYRGDPSLLGFRYGWELIVDRAREGHLAPVWLLGETREGGWWYFFPVAFFMKTPAALHLLLPLSLAGLLIGVRRRIEARGGPGTWREALRSRLRGPVVGAAVFGVFLIASSLNVGFRYALPALPPLLLVVAVGVSRLWSVGGRRVRLGVLLLLFLHAGSTLSSWPWLLSYRSEWIRTRPPGREALLDSSVDWGQGLLALRDFMEEEGVEGVRLSYFGSALPEGYGIMYEPLPSLLELPPAGDGAEDPRGPLRWTVIAATNLHGLYFSDADPFAAYRDRTPDRILAGSLYLYDEGR